MTKRLISFIVVLLAFLPLFSQSLVPVSGKVDNGYNFWFYTPKEALEEPADSFPLVIYLHGRSLNGTNLETVKKYGTITALDRGREIEAFVIGPQNPGGFWKPEKLMNTVDYVCENFNVDTDRIYVLGMCLGGYGALDFAATYPDRIAAAIGVSGGAYVKDISGLAEMPVWLIHGTNDASVPVSESDKVANKVREAQEDEIDRLAYSRLNGVNHSKTVRIFYNSETYDWLLSHSLSTPGRPVTPPEELNEEYFGKSYNGLSRGKSSSNGKKQK